MRQPLRVAILARSVYPLHRYGGLERHVFDLVRYLLARELRVTLISPPPAANRPMDSRAEALWREPGLTLMPVPYVTFPFANRRGTTIADRSTAYPLFGLRAGRLAARLVASGQLDVVHGLGASVLGYATADRRSRSAPLVFNPQGLEEFGATDPSRARLKRLGYWPLRAAVRYCAGQATCVVATDQSLVASVRGHLGVPPERIRVIPNAIELGECDPVGEAVRASELRDLVGAMPDDPILLSVGRLEANKGFHVLVQALGVLARTGGLPSRWRWVLVGEGPLKASLERAIASAGLGGHARLWGRAEPADLHGWYTAATLFVHPTLYEGSSLVTLEAMAHSKAIVACRSGGLPDKVRSDVNGWLVAPGDPQALGAAVQTALSSATRLREMGRMSRRIVEHEFSWDAVADKLLELYADLLA